MDSIPELLLYLPNAETNPINIPKTLQDQTTWIKWTPQWNQKKSKFLKYSPHSNNPKNHKTLNALTVSAYRASQPLYAALYFTKQCNIICLDLDDPADQQIADFVKRYPTFQEYSPSGQEKNKRHAWYQLDVPYNQVPAIKDQETGPFASSKPTRFQGKTELFIHSHYITVTGDKTPESLDVVTLLSENALAKLASLFVKKEKDQTTRQSLFSMKSKIQLAAEHSLPDLVTWTNTVPCNHKNPMVRLRQEDEGWSHYDYWLTGLAAIHYFSQGNMEGLTFADKWSAKDPDNYDGFEDVKNKWESFTLNRPEAVTERTYMVFFKWFQLDWPHVQKKPGSKVAVPSPTSYKNFLALLDFYGISISIDCITLTPFIKGPKGIVFPQFYEDPEEQYGYQNNYETIASKIFIWAQDFYQVSNSTCQSHVKAYCQNLKQKSFFNPFISWLEEEPWDQIDRFDDQLFPCFHVDKRYTDPSLAKVFLKRWMFSVLRSFYLDRLPKNYRYSSAEGVLIVSGPERTNKTTAFRMMLPQEMERYYVSAPVTLDGQSGEKDSLLRSVGRLISVMDEIEIVINGTKEARFKEFVTRTTDSFRPPYAIKNQDFKRRCSFAGTTNKVELHIPEDGARRYWFMRVTDIDTYSMLNIDKQQLWAQLRDEMIKLSGEGIRAPWLLTGQEIEDQQKNVLQFHSTTNEFDLLIDMYDWEQLIPFSEQMKKDCKTWKERTMSIKQVCEQLNIPRSKSLTYAIKRCLKQYAPERLRTVKGGVVEQGIYILSGQKRFMMPPLRSDLFDVFVDKEKPLD